MYICINKYILVYHYKSVYIYICIYIYFNIFDECELLNKWQIRRNDRKTFV